MKGVFLLGNRQLEVRELLKPEVRSGLVLIKTVMAGVCGSDLHPYRAAPSANTSRFAQGHELVGVVEAVGEGVEHLKPGDRVMAHQAWGCGVCEYCAGGRPNLCANRKIIGKADRYQKGYAVMPENIALPVPDGLTMDDALMLSCAGGTAWAALRRVRPTVDDIVVVFGLGPVGLMGVFWAKAMGAYVVGVEMIEERRALGLAAGADLVLDPGAEDPLARIMDLTDGRGATVGFEGSGNKAAQKQLIECTHFEARVVYVAVGGPGAVIEPSVGRRGHLGLRTVYGTFTFTLPDYFDMTRALLLHDLHPGSMITHRYPIEQAAEAYAVADAGRCGKVVLQGP